MDAENPGMPTIFPAGGFFLDTLTASAPER
jgi:hypothetical protein